MIIVQNEMYDGTISECVIIENQDGSQTCYSKSVWDELQAQQAEHLNGSVDGEAL